jgi:hypothetical protein
MIAYNLDSANHASYRAAGGGYLHYLHGTNPNGIVYLSHMGAYGAERSATELFHQWFADGTDWDNALTSPKGPPPGFLQGGAYPGFSGTGLPTPPAGGQPVQKAYGDLNTGSPLNAWEFTEPAIIYQAAYIRLLAAMIP